VVAGMCRTDTIVRSTGQNVQPGTIRLRSGQPVNAGKRGFKKIMSPVGAAAVGERDGNITTANIETIVVPLLRRRTSCRATESVPF